jgi:hypothetical protein
MPEPTFIQWVIGQTGLAGLAAFCIWMLMQREKEHQSDMKDLLIDVKAALEKNTAAMLRVAEHPDGACPLDTEGLLSVLKRLANAKQS